MRSKIDTTVNSMSISPATLPTTVDRHPAARDIYDRLRPGQRQMAEWNGGELAVSAVPGSGKSTGMAAAAALAVARHNLHPRRQLVVVTFTRSAAASLKAKIRNYLKELSVPPGGFVVHTLHGLALNIAQRHRELSGLSWDNLTVVPLDRNHRLIRTCVERWIVSHTSEYRQLIEGAGFDGEETERLRRQSVLRTDVLPTLTETAIREAKSSGLSPSDLRELGRNLKEGYPILNIAAGLYDRYETLLRSRDLVDYDDMILSALRVLENEDVRRFWQRQVFGVFEDEAQDSSPLQSQLLNILAADPDGLQPPNLVRVGDPNQAINSTFTPADPIYFRRFCDRCQRNGHLATIDRAGRSTQAILDAANYVVDWVNQGWYNKGFNADEVPFRRQYIQPVLPGDPQPDANPEPEGGGVELYTPATIYDTIELLGKCAVELLENHPDRAAAVLVRTNDRGRIVTEELERLYGQRLKIYDVGQSDRRSRIPQEILALMQFIDRPHSPDNLKAALTVLVDRQLIPTQDLDALASLPETFLYPTPLEESPSPAIVTARQVCRSLLRARLELPSFHLIPFLALTLDYDAAELATADKLGDRIAIQTSGDTAIGAILATLNDIARNERFDPVETDKPESIYARPGWLTVITMHKAKGLDWDYVFLPFLHEKDLPGSLWIPPQVQFLGDFSLAEVARSQIRTAARDREIHSVSPVATADESWQSAQQLKIAEEYRLFYVAMTRAKRLLWCAAAQDAPFTWNKPENISPRDRAPVLTALMQRFPHLCC